jgi:hypothetical protein
MSVRRRREVIELHQRMIREWPLAAKLHCVYVRVEEVVDVGSLVDLPGFIWRSRAPRSRRRGRP